MGSPAEWFTRSTPPPRPSLSSPTAVALNPLPASGRIGGGTNSVVIDRGGVLKRDEGMSDPANRQGVQGVYDKFTARELTLHLGHIHVGEMKISWHSSHGEHTSRIFLSLSQLTISSIRVSCGDMACS